MSPRTPRSSPSNGRARHATASGADIVIDVSGPTVADCLALTVERLIATFADTSDVAATDPIPIAVGPSRPDQMLVRLIEEAISLVEVFDLVPASVELADTEGGGVAGFFDAAPAKAVKFKAARPRAVSVRDTDVRPTEAGWSCTATVTG